MRQLLKLFSLFTIMSIILIVSTSQKDKTTNIPQQTIKNYVVILDGNTWQKIQYVMNQSSTSHTLVTLCLDSINKQLYDSAYQSKMEKLLK